MISQKRHVVALIRKRQMFKCGCEGWCSQFPLMTLLRWSLKARADGKYVCGGGGGGGSDTCVADMSLSI